MGGDQAKPNSTRPQILIIAYATDELFLANPLVKLAMAQPKFRTLHDVLAEVFADPRVRLAMRHDLAPPSTQASWNGAPALALVPTGCLAVVRRLMGWSYRTLAEQVGVSAGWRWVCHLDYRPMPNFRTLQERAARLSRRTLRLIHARVLDLARQMGVTLGQRLRLDGSVIDTNIHYPTDSRLLDDAARVLSRGLRQARGLLAPRTPQAKRPFHDRHRQAHWLARQIAQATRKGAKNTAKLAKKLYRQLLQLVAQLLDQIAQVQPQLTRLSGLAAAGLVELFRHYQPLVQQVVAQTRRRVLEGVKVAATDKLVSLFEPHTAIIRRGKAPPHETEFGIKVWYAEVEGGLISEYRLLRGNPQVWPSPTRSQWRPRVALGRERAPIAPTGCAPCLPAPTGLQIGAPQTAGTTALVSGRAAVPKRHRRPHQPFAPRAPTGSLSQSWLGRPGALGRVGCHCQ
jgi:hypothetical protein